MHAHRATQDPTVSCRESFSKLPDRSRFLCRCPFVKRTRTLFVHVSRLFLTRHRRVHTRHLHDLRLSFRFSFDPNSSRDRFTDATLNFNNVQIRTTIFPLSRNSVPFIPTFILFTAIFSFFFLFFFFSLRFRETRHSVYRETRLVNDSTGKSKIAIKD